MSGRNDQEHLFGLMEQIERAWMEQGDYTVVDRLAAEHPALAEELYEFFASVVDAPDYLDKPRPELATLSQRIRQRLQREMADDRLRQSTGTETSSAAASPTDATPATLLGLLRSVGAEPEEAAKRLDITMDFLAELSRHSQLLPRRAKGEIAARMERKFLVARPKTMGVLESGVRQARAASRQGGYEQRTLTYGEIVKRSTLSDEQKEHWLALTEESG